MRVHGQGCALEGRQQCCLLLPLAGTASSPALSLATPCPHSQHTIECRSMLYIFSSAAVIIVGNWLASLRHEGLVNGAYLMAPVGNFIVAVMGPLLDPKYHEVQTGVLTLAMAALLLPVMGLAWPVPVRLSKPEHPPPPPASPPRQVCFLWFGFALIMWIALFVFSFQRTVSGDGIMGRRNGTAWSKQYLATSQYVCSQAMLCCPIGPGLTHCLPPRLPPAPQVLGHNADPRSRVFAAIWMAAPAVASIAWTVLEAARWACLVRVCRAQA